MSPPTSSLSRRGRKIRPDDLARRITVFEDQELEGFTNQEAAQRARMGLPAWNQWKQKHRRELDGQAVVVPRPPRSGGSSREGALPSARGHDAREVAEVIRLRSRVAELETLLAGLRNLLDQFAHSSAS